MDTMMEAAEKFVGIEQRKVLTMLEIVRDNDPEVWQAFLEESPDLETDSECSDWFVRLVQVYNVFK